MQRNLKRLLVTGGAGFIGSSFIRYLLQSIIQIERVINLDLLTYAANLKNLEKIEKDVRYQFVQGDIRDELLVERLCVEEKIDAIVHFAAESHVDRSIVGPKDFYETNVGGTFTLLEVIRRHPSIHFHHISTDEVYGSLPLGKEKFSETSSYRPNSPYAASKAASDHFVRAYHHTYGISTTLSHCTNNYGPCQHEEKWIPTIIMNCLRRTPIPVYGDGTQVRDWLFVDDHSQAVWEILKKGKKGDVYDISGECEKQNLSVIATVIKKMVEKGLGSQEELNALIVKVDDRPGHDVRYAIDPRKMKTELGFKPTYSFSEGVSQTIDWYLNAWRLVSL